MKVYPEMNVPDEGISRHALYVLNLIYLTQIPMEHKRDL